MKNYGIKEGYVARTEVPDFDDTPFKDEWQDDVYQLAAKEAKSMRAQSVIDLGCGSGFKLMKYFKHLHTVGIDRAPTVEWLNGTYPGRDWRTLDEPVWFHPWDNILVCSDVIEHVEDPDLLLDKIVALNPLRAVISTPDRYEIKLGTENGPPRNRHHVREWAHDEFVAYLSERFTVLDSRRGKTTIAVVREKI